MSMTTISERNSISVQDVLTQAVDAQHTEGVHLRGMPILCLLVPTTNGASNIMAEVSIDGGTTWYALKDADGSTNSIEIAEGGSGFVVSADELSSLAGCVGRVDKDTNVLVRWAFATAQSVDRTLTWLLVA